MSFNNIIQIINEEIENTQLSNRIRCLEKTLAAELNKYAGSDNYDDKWFEIRQVHRRLENYLKDGAFLIGRDYNDIWINNFVKGLNYSENNTYVRGDDVTNEFPELKSENINIYKASGDKTLFRGISVDDWNRIQTQGYMDSDMRGAITVNEGINLAQNPTTAQYYLPPNDQGVILAINPRGLNLYMLSDEYIRVFEPISLKNIINVSDVIIKNDMGGILATDSVNRQILNNIENKLKELNVKFNCN